MSKKKKWSNYFDICQDDKGTWTIFHRESSIRPDAAYSSRQRFCVAKRLDSWELACLADEVTKALREDLRQTIKVANRKDDND